MDFENLKVSWSLGFVRDLLQKGLMQNPVDHEIVFIACMCKTPLGFSSIETPLVPYSPPTLTGVGHQ